MRQDLDSRPSRSQDERTGGSRTGSSEQFRVIVRDNQTDDEDEQDVEDCDTPEQPSNSFGEGNAGVFDFCCRDDDTLNASERAGCLEKIGKEAQKLAEIGILVIWGKRSRIFPVSESDSVLVRSTPKVDDKSKDDETDTKRDCHQYWLKARRMD